MRIFELGRTLINNSTIWFIEALSRKYDGFEEVKTLVSGQDSSEQLFWKLSDDAVYLEAGGVYSGFIKVIFWNAEWVHLNIL